MVVIKKSFKNWSGREDSNLRPLPPEECSPIGNGGITPFYGAGRGAANREMAVVTVTRYRYAPWRMIRAIWARIRAWYRKATHCPYDAPGCTQDNPCVECWREEAW